MANDKQTRDRRKLRVLTHYGGKCECCGEKHQNLLSLDHVNGGGNQHRQEVKARGSSFYQWVVTNKFPALFRVLCGSCNSAYGHFGWCPHQYRREPLGEYE